MSEREFARRIAEKVLDNPRRDPDDDLAVLSRQLLRAFEREAALSPSAQAPGGDVETIAELQKRIAELEDELAHANGAAIGMASALSMTKHAHAAALRSHAVASAWQPIAYAPENERLLFYFPPLSSRSPHEIAIGRLPKGGRQPSLFCHLPDPPRSLPSDGDGK